MELTCFVNYKMSSTYMNLKFLPLCAESMEIDY